jgi:acetyl esterase/lipase
MEKIYLWEKNAPSFDCSVGQEEPCLLPYPVQNSNCAVIVLPGGAYAGRAEDHEGVKIAKRLNQLGITAFILRYRYAPYRHPIPLTDARRAVSVVRSLASHYGYAQNHLAILGFSAGGHLAATTLLSRYQGLKVGDAIDEYSDLPNLGILCYPVIDMESPFAHRGSVENLLGDPQSPSFDAQASALSLQKAVTSDTPPCFIWHTAADSCVPVENALLFAAALSQNRVPFELHIYPYGDHGLGLGEDTMPYLSGWIEQCVRFIHLHFQDKDS